MFPKDLRNEKQRARYQKTPEDDEDTKKLQQQLNSAGLELVDIVGDGNCLFRALSQQLEGSQNGHLQIRKRVVEFLSENRSEFEFFVEDDVPFDRHIRNMAQPGTYGGNMEIVAFARLYQCDVAVHQNSTPALMISCGAQSGKVKKTIHIAYHSWEHYSAVRMIGSNSNDDTMISASMVAAKPQPASAKEKRLMQATLISDLGRIRQLLNQFGGDESAIVEHVFAERAGWGESTSLHGSFADMQQEEYSIEAVCSRQADEQQQYASQACYDAFDVGRPTISQAPAFDGISPDSASHSSSKASAANSSKLPSLESSKSAAVHKSSTITPSLSSSPSLSGTSFSSSSSSSSSLSADTSTGAASKENRKAKNRNAKEDAKRQRRLKKALGHDAESGHLKDQVHEDTDAESLAAVSRQIQFLHV